LDRYINFAGQIPLETDLLNTNRNILIALSKLSHAVFGNTTTVNGLACTPTGPASMSVNVAPGDIYSLVNLDGTPYSSLAADTTHQVVKQGISLDLINFALTAPVTGGYSVCYLIEAQYQDLDAVNVVLPYYNAAAPATAWSGPNNTGVAQATQRKGNALVQVKTGVAAATGTQTIPAADSGFVPLYVVTVANGQTTITAASIALHAQAPLIPSSIVQAMQTDAYSYAIDTGTANAYAAKYTPSIAALTDGMQLWFKASNSNTGASTLSVNGLTSSPLLGPTQLPLAAATILANGQYQVVWNAGLSSWVLCNAGGAAGGLTNITATSPLTSTGGTSPTLAMPAATGSVNGYLKAVDWAAFNAKGIVNSLSVTAANGVSGTFTGGSTPALTLVLGAITPSSVAATGGISAASATISGIVNATTLTASGAVNGASAAITGAANVGSVTATGAVNAASAAITGAMTAASLSTSGAVTASGGFQSSDKRLKTNIRARDVQRGFALKLARMFCEWDRLADGAHDVGLIAQRVKTLAARYVIRGQGKLGMLAIDKAGIALEASMDNALSVAELQADLKSMHCRLAKLERGQ
jgi:hypothetical protein